MNTNEATEISYKNGYEKGVRDFAKRLEERKYQSSDWSHGEHPFVVEENDIEEVLEEMVGADVPGNNFGDKSAPTDKDINVPSKWMTSELALAFERAKDPLPRFLMKENGDIVPLTNCQQWISVKDMLPDKNISSQFYLCYWNGYIRVCKYWRTRKVFELRGKEVKVTHWMPLPEPPKGE